MNARADVMIVGGGFAGMATAWALRRRGIRDVVVLERAPEIGRFASGRSAGLGRQLAEHDALTALTVRGAALLRTCFAEAWTPTGGVLSFDRQDHAEAYVQRGARFGVPAQPLDRDRVLQLWPELAGVELAAALLVPDDGVISVGPLLAAYARGVEVRCGVGVEQIVADGQGARLVTDQGELAARVVVDACGAWAGRATGDPPLPSYKRHVYVLEAQAAAGAPFVWHLGDRELYVRGADGRVMCSPCDASAAPPGDPQPDAGGEASLRRVLRGTPLDAAQIARAWACQRTFPRAGSAVEPGMQLGRDASRPWLVWAVGLGGHGATASAAVGEAVAASVVSALG